VPLALVATGFAAVLLVAFDVWGTITPERKQVAFLVDDPVVTLASLRALWPTARVIHAPVLGEAPHKVVLELDLPESVDAATLLEGAQRAGITGIHQVGITDD